MFLPIAFVLSLLFLQQGSPMTFQSSVDATTLEPAAMGTTESGQAKPQTLIVGPLAAFIPMKMLGTNGGGFYGMNSAHPFENPTDFTNFLSTVAMILYPTISAFFGFDDHRAGVFIGATVHDVAQVVGAGYAISREAGDTATVVKLMRVAMLLPVVVSIGLWARARGAHGEGERPPLLPWFVTAFAVLVVFNSLVPLPEFVRDAGNTASRGCLITAIAALGIKTHFQEIVDIGWKPVVLMVLETIFIAGLVLAALWGGLL
jgi:hypothetical protein